MGVRGALLAHQPKKRLNRHGTSLNLVPDAL